MTAAAEDVEQDDEVIAEENDAGVSDGAETADGSQPASNTAADAPDTGHQGQFGLRLGVVAGYRMMFRYAESPFCGPPSSEEEESCFYGSPWSTDLALTFAPFDSLELFGWGRLGLGRDTKTDTDPLRVIGAGVRIYMMSDAPLKFFVQPAVAFSLEGGGQDPAWRARGGVEADYRSDLLFHFSVGPQYDFNRHFGIYAGGGMTVGASRAMSANLEGTLGVQGRYP